MQLSIAFFIHPRIHYWKFEIATTSCSCTSFSYLLQTNSMLSRTFYHRALTHIICTHKHTLYLSSFVYTFRFLCQKFNVFQTLEYILLNENLRRCSSLTTAFIVNCLWEHVNNIVYCVRFCGRHLILKKIDDFKKMFMWWLFF